MSEATHTLQGVAQNLREDGRARLDFRHLALEVGLLPQTSGSARLCSGIDGTDVLVGVIAVLAVPEPATPDLGRITVSVGGCEAVAAGLPDYAAAGLAVDAKRVWLEEALARLYAATSVPEVLHTLCIAPGLQCWELRVCVQLLRADGCPLDAAALAIRAALHDTRVPKVSVAASSGADNLAPGAPLDLDLDETLDESSPFDAATLPLYVTLASLDGMLVSDCTAKERRAAGSAISLGLDGQGRVCALCTAGCYGLPCSEVPAAMDEAQRLCAELHEAASGAILEAARGSEARGGAAGGAAVGLLA